MIKIIRLLVVLILIVGTAVHISSCSNSNSNSLDLVYYIDPNSGDDSSNSGVDKDSPWRTFHHLNRADLKPGTTIKVLSAGDLTESLLLSGSGSQESPIRVEFAPGRYNFFPESGIKRKFNISNTNDDPDGMKSIAILIERAKYVTIEGEGAEIIMRGKSILMAIDSSEDIEVNGLTFDYHRPTVSEFQVLNIDNRSADIDIHKDSDYSIVDSLLRWQGEGWSHPIKSLVQICDTKSERVYRSSLDVDNFRFVDLGDHRVRIYSQSGSLDLKEGVVYQNRDTFRDYAAIFSNRSKRIEWRGVTVNFMHGMGFVSQFCEDITFKDLCVAPKEGSGRTCAAWADILHFSGCRGSITVDGSYLSATNDDAINVHGTYLRVIEILSDKSVKVRFMHPQTYGFRPFIEGDSIEFTDNKTLIGYEQNRVRSCIESGDREYILTLEREISGSVVVDHAIENISWCANLYVTNTTAAYIPTRGFLISTRGEVVVEGCRFNKTTMSGLLIAGDVNSWFESGAVKSLTVKDNDFIECGYPIINIHPEVKELKTAQFVHSNITLIDNRFEYKSDTFSKGSLLSAQSVDGLTIENSTIYYNKNLNIDLDNINEMIKCSSVKNLQIQDNILKSTH